MFDRNELVHAVFWPDAEHPKEAKINLVDTDGVVQGEIDLDRPIKGAELASMVPNGFYLSPLKCIALSMSGKQVVATKAPFDTAVVTERPEVSFEDRMARLERREMRRERRERQREEEHQRIMAEAREAAEGVPDEPVIDEDDVAPGDVVPAGELTEEAGSDENE